MISILILTLNEQDNLPECIKSVAWSDDIVVLDSFSKDRTTDIAKEMNARVFQRKFDTWAQHQNWAMEQIPWKNRWVFYIDADERMTPELHAEMKAIATDPDEKRVAFYVGRMNYFMGKWIRHAMPPTPVMRFFVPEKIRFERLIHVTPVVDGEYGYLKNLFQHFNFSKGVSDWLRKHNQYSTLEAVVGVEVIRGEQGTFFDHVRRAMHENDQMERRKSIKSVTYYLPCRAAARFFHVYFIKLGLLDGLAGLYYAVLASIYEYWISVKMLERQSHWADDAQATVKRLMAEEAHG